MHSQGTSSSQQMTVTMYQSTPESHIHNVSDDPHKNNTHPSLSSSGAINAVSRNTTGLSGSSASGTQGAHGCPWCAHPERILAEVCRSRRLEATCRNVEMRSIPSGACLASGFRVSAHVDVPQNNRFEKTFSCACRMDQERLLMCLSWQRDFVRVCGIALHCTDILVLLL